MKKDSPNGRRAAVAGMTLGVILLPIAALLLARFDPTAAGMARAGRNAALNPWSVVDPAGPMLDPFAAVNADRPNHPGIEATPDGPTTEHLPAVLCFAPGTPPDLMARVNQALHGSAAQGRFFLLDRWPGDDGTPLTLTWSLVPDGLDIELDLGDAVIDGPSVLFARLGRPVRGFVRPVGRTVRDQLRPRVRRRFRG